MKKLFTLIAVALMAMTASANQVLTELKNAAFGLPEDGTVAAWGWNQAGTNDSQSHQEADGSWVTDKEATYNYGDATGFDYVVIKFKQTCATKFICVSGGWATQPTVSVAAGASYAAVDFAATGTTVTDINAFVLQPTENGNIIIDQIEYMTKAEYDAYVEEQSHVVKEQDFANPAVDGVLTMTEGEDAWGWYSPCWFGTSAESLASLYKTIVFEVAKSDGPFKITIQDYADEGSENITFEVATVTAPVVIACPVASITKSFGQYAFQNDYVTETYSEGGSDHSWLGENKVQITRTYYTSEVVESTYTPNAIVNVKADAAKSNVMYNLAGQRVSNAKGIVIKNGVKYVVK